MEFKIVIPSHNRIQTLRNKTLSFLRVQQIPLDKIYIFVASDQFQLYKEAFPEYQIIEGKLGLVNQRNFITEYFEDNQYLLSMDDDISDIQYLNQENQYETINLITLVQEGFETSLKHAKKFWTVYATKSKLYQQRPLSVGFYYGIGAFFGVINDKSISVSLDYAEDIERSFLHTVKYGGIIRLNRYCIITKYYTETGGLQDTRTVENNNQCKMYLVEHFPEYFKAYERNGRLELRFLRRKNFIQPDKND
jgi:hypothetical protein